MPQLAKKKFQIQSASGEELVFECACYVNAAGVFSIRVPDQIPDFRKTVQAIIKDERFKGAKLEKGREYWNVTGESLSLCEQVIGHAGHEYLKFDEQRETVILYNYDSHCHYCEDSSGTIYLNISDAAANNGASPFIWKGSQKPLMDYETHESFYVGIFARVFTKITQRRGDYKKVTYHHPSHEAVPGFQFHHLAMETYAERLNGAPRLYKRPDVGGDGELMGLKEMPYSEDAARFFYETLIGICKLHRIISGIVGDDTLLKKAIESRSGLMIEGPKKA